MATPSVLTGRELSKSLGLSYSKVMDWASSGDIPSIRNGGRVYFNLGKVIQAMRANRQSQATAETSAEAVA